MTMAVCEVCGKRPTKETTLLNAVEVLRALEGDELQHLSDLISQLGLLCIPILSKNFGLISQLGSKASELHEAASKCSQAEATTSVEPVQQKEANPTNDYELQAIKGRASSALVQNASELQKVFKDITLQRESACTEPDMTPAVQQKLKVETQILGKQASETEGFSESAEMMVVMPEVSCATASELAPTIQVPLEQETEALPPLEKSPSFGMSSDFLQSPKFGFTSAQEGMALSATMPPAIPSPRPNTKPLPSPMHSSARFALGELVSNRPGAAAEVGRPGASGAMNPIAKRRQMVQQQMARGKSGRIARPHQGSTPMSASKTVSLGLGSASNQSGSGAGTPLPSPRVGSACSAPLDEMTNGISLKTASTEKPLAQMDSPLSAACPVPQGPPAVHAPPQRLSLSGADPYDGDVSPVVSPLGQSTPNISPPRSPATGAFFHGPSASSKIIEPACSKSYSHAADSGFGGSQNDFSSRVPEDLLTKDHLDWDIEGAEDDFHAPEPQCRMKGFMSAPSGSSWGGSLSMNASVMSVPLTEPTKPALDPPRTSRPSSMGRSKPMAQDADDLIADVKAAVSKAEKQTPMFETTKAVQPPPSTVELEDPDDPLEDLRRTLGGRDRNSAPSRDSSQPTPRPAPHVPVAPNSERPSSTVRPRVGLQQRRVSGDSNRASSLGRSCFGGARSYDASVSPRAPLSSFVRDESLTPPLIS